MKQEIETAILDFRSKIKEAKQNPLLENLAAYERLIADNIENGNLATGKYHAELLVEFYIDENPYSPDEESEMARIKDSNPRLYQAMDAGRKAYHIGKAAQSLIALL
ncbi:MAG: hypothetical protein WC796_03430 [Candidatus Pacearchaeota archaeon]|jgi:hypothetical protein